MSQVKCGVCGKVAKPYDSSKNQIGETYYSISWELVDEEEYERRVNLGIPNTSLDVCPEHYEEYTGRKYKDGGTRLHEIANQRK